MTGESKPVLWVSLTTEGRHSSPDTLETIADVKERLDEAVGEDYEVVVADDRVRLLDAEQVREMMQDLTEQAQRFGNEDALFSAAMGEDEGESDPEDST